jgi:hypothetical protein
MGHPEGRVTERPQAWTLVSPGLARYHAQEPARLSHHHVGSPRAARRDIEGLRRRPMFCGDNAALSNRERRRRRRDDHTALILEMSGAIGVEASQGACGNIGSCTPRDVGR